MFFYLASISVLLLPCSRNSLFVLDRIFRSLMQVTSSGCYTARHFGKPCLCSKEVVVEERWRPNYGQKLKPATILRHLPQNPYLFSSSPVTAVYILARLSICQNKWFRRSFRCEPKGLESSLPLAIPIVYAAPDIIFSLNPSWPIGLPPTDIWAPDSEWPLGSKRWN